MKPRGTSLHFTPDRRRYFLVPDGTELTPGDLVVTTQVGQERSVQPEEVEPFEVTGDQARAWAKVELANTLDELKTNIDTGLAKLRAQLEAKDQTPIDASSPVTPNAVSAIVDLLTALPRVVGQGLSADETRVAAARETMAELQRRLHAAGVEVDDRLQQFPERLAGLRKAPGEAEND